MRLRRERPGRHPQSLGGPRQALIDPLSAAGVEAGVEICVGSKVIGAELSLPDKISAGIGVELGGVIQLLSGALEAQVV